MTNKLLKVYGFPRSGSNLMMALLKANFYTDVDLSVSGWWGHFNDRRGPKLVEYGKLFGHHGAPHGINFNNAIYMVRDGRAVVTSVYRSDGFLSKGMRALSFSEYLRASNDWSESPGWKDNQAGSVIGCWYRHTQKWNMSMAHNPIMMIPYENIVTNPEPVLKTISKHFGLTRTCKKYINAVEPVGPSPNKGVIDEWKEWFSEEDLKFFFGIVPKDYCHLHRLP